MSTFFNRFPFYFSGSHLKFLTLACLHSLNLLSDQKIPSVILATQEQQGVLRGQTEYFENSHAFRPSSQGHAGHTSLQLTASGS